MKTITFTIPGTVYTQIQGSELGQRPEFYDDVPATHRAFAAFKASTSRRVGRFGHSHTLTCDTEAAEVIAECCSTVGQAFAGESEPETRREGRALLKSADTIRTAIKAA